MAASPAAAADLEEVANAVVKLYVTHQGWTPKQPWSKEPVGRRTCTGFFVPQGILTNAHCIQDDTFMQIEVPGLADRIPVVRVAINHQVDLALVQPADPSLLPDVTPIRFGSLPEQREKVVTIGYSIGGRQVSFTEGVVSRIDVMTYAHSNLSNLLVQTDAAINPGNSGGPVFSDRSGECVGMATQRYSGSIGYFIPVPVIEQFLADYEDGAIDGIPYLGIQVQQLENPTLREYLGMQPGQSGVRVSKVAEGDAPVPLRRDDVLMKVEGKQIFNDGRIPFRGFNRIGLGFEIASRQIGERLRFTVLRGGEEMEVDVPLTARDYHVVPSLPLYDQQPPYFVIGGLLFRAIEPNYLGKEVPFNVRRYLGTMREEGLPDELVVISSIYEADLNKGYDNTQENVRVLTVNGRTIRRLVDVPPAFEENEGRYHVVELETGDTVVLDRQRVEADEASIRARYRIE